MQREVQRVPEEALEPFHTRCPVCGDGRERQGGLLLQTSPEVSMVTCQGCGASFADRFPRAEFLRELYDPTHYSSPVSSDDHLARRCAERIAKSFHPQPNAPVRVLDYGGNRGGLVRALRDGLVRDGHRGDILCTVVDIFPFPDETKIRFITPEQFENEREQYDLVLASAVLEHLPDMPRVLKKLLMTLRPNGFFYARTPYDLPIAQLGWGYRVRWPGHLYDLGPEFWQRLPDSLCLPELSQLVSRPSLVESRFSRRPVHTTLAHLLKLPGYVEARVRGTRPTGTNRLWRFVGGWEVILSLSGEVAVPQTSGSAH